VEAFLANRLIVGQLDDNRQVFIIKIIESDFYS
jgi:hypothetical protein